jgi:predicted methyltransferase
MRNCSSGQPTCVRAYSVLLVLAVSLYGLSVAAAEADDALRAAIAGSHRTPDFVARDGARHPYETLSFFGIRPDMTVIEVWPGGGWYTEILAPYLRDRGKLYAAHFSADAELKYFRELRVGFLHKLAAAPARAIKSAGRGARGMAARCAGSSGAAVDATPASVQDMRTAAYQAMYFMCVSPDSGNRFRTPYRAAGWSVTGPFCHR